MTERASSPRMALIEWIDSALQVHPDRVWFDPAHVSIDIQPIRSIGFVFRDEPDVITLVDSISSIDGLFDWDHMGAVSNPFRIPKGCIRSIVYLEESCPM